MTTIKTLKQVETAYTKWLTKELKSVTLQDGEDAVQFELPEINCYESKVNGKWAPTRQTIELGGTEYEMRGETRRSIAGMLYKTSELVVNNLKRRGYLLMLSYNEASDYDGGWSRSTYFIPVSVLVTRKPCKEFLRLKSWLIKFANTSIKDFDIYDVHLFGKRGSYDEHGCKTFLCHKPERCAMLLKTLQSVRMTGDTLKVTVSNDDNVPDLDYSVEMETECYGHRHRVANVEITSKSGKRRGTIVLHT